MVSFFYETKEAPHYSFRKIGHLRVHNISDPKLMRAITKDRERFSGIAFVSNTFKKMIGSALITDEGESWQVMHDIMAGAFKPASIEKNVAPIALEECNAMIDRWIARGRVSDIEHEMRDMTGRIITRMLFSDTVSPADGQKIIDEVTRAMAGAEQPRGFKKILRKMNVPYDHAGFIPPVLLRVTGLSYDRPASVPKAFLQATRNIDAVLYRIIVARRALETQPDDMLGRLITAQRPDGTRLSDEQIRDQVIMLVVTGHETTAGGMTFSLLEILRNAEVQKRLRDEFNSVVGDRSLSGADYPSLLKAQAAFKEALRLHPVVMMMTREALADTTLGDIKIKKNDIIRMDLRELHRSPDYWPDPLAYNPERFEKGNTSAAFLPFGAGPRTCIGINMSMYEGALMLSQIFNRLDLSIAKEPIGEQYFFTARPVGTLDVDVRRREKAAPVPKPQPDA